MAQARAIFQPVQAGHEHAKELNAFDKQWVKRLLVSSAYVNSAGVDAASKALSSKAALCKVFVGVRNGSSTAQGVAALLNHKVEVYGVDTATRSRIFHPKLYLGVGDEEARAVIGSANLTHAGMFNNIEAGAELTLKLEEVADKAFVDQFEAGFQSLIDDHPEHCFRISTKRQVVELMKQGLLEDERDPKTATAVGAGSQGPKTAKATIKLPYKAPPKSKNRQPKKPATGAGAAVSGAPTYGQLVWMKPNLPEGDLQLLNVGHVSGVLRLTQARYEVNGNRIDQTTYFRRKVFAGLSWTPDPSQPQKERAVAPVALVVAGVYVGDFDLRLTHNPAWEAGQGNYTTGMHWDDALPHIKKPGFVGRTLYLYAPSSAGGRYVVEID